jgi:hypothetical protein
MKKLKNSFSSLKINNMKLAKGLSLILLLLSQLASAQEMKLESTQKIKKNLEVKIIQSILDLLKIN